MSKKKERTYKRSGGVGRVVYLSNDDNRLFKQTLANLPCGVNKCADELADEIFRRGLHLKSKELQKTES